MLLQKSHTLLNNSHCLSLPFHSYTLMMLSVNIVSTIYIYVYMFCLSVLFSCVVLSLLAKKCRQLPLQKTIKSECAKKDIPPSDHLNHHSCNKCFNQKSLLLSFKNPKLFCGQRWKNLSDKMRFGTQAYSNTPVILLLT